MKQFLIRCSCLFFMLLISCGEGKNRQEEESSDAATDTLSTEGQEQMTSEEDPGVILFFGNSLTAGMGLDPEEAFPNLIQNRIDSLGLPYEVVNAGLSGETTAGGRNRIDWVLNQDIEVFVLELGANDGLRGVPLEETRKNLQAIINTVREKDPDTEIILAGMQIPPNLGQEYASGFRNIFPELAEENDLHLIPFLLEDVAGVPELNQRDGIHPTAEGQQILAENVWDVLEDVIREKSCFSKSFPPKV